MTKLIKNFQSSWQSRPTLWRLYLLFLALLALVIFLQVWSQLLNLLLLVAAYSFGVFLLWADENFLYSFYSENIDYKDKNITHNSLIDAPKNRTMTEENPTDSDQQLITRQPLFLLVLIPLSFFVLTSTGSIAGVAMIMAINLYLLIEMWQLHAYPEQFQKRFSLDNKKKLSKNEVQSICYFASVYFILLIIIGLL